MSVTQEVVQFAGHLSLEAVPPRVVDLAKGFLLDGLGVIVAGSTEEGSRIVQAHVAEMGGVEQATLLGVGWRGPAPAAALANGTAGHALDYDDTQLTTVPEHTYGLLTHPTIPVLAAVLAVAEQRGLSGRELLLAYIAGVEVECRIADAILPRHYQEGFHSTATIGGLGAVVAAGTLLKLDEGTMLRALGISASLSGGLRENFGTMTKPLHAGRAAQNGVVAADLARRGFTAAPNILEGPRGFYRAMAGGFEPARLGSRLGRPFFFESPGISIKPYPSGSLTHPGLDLWFDLIRRHGLTPATVAVVEVGTNRHTLSALKYPVATTDLEGKFSMAFCLAIALLEGKAGIAQFTTAKARDPRTVEVMRRIRHVVDPAVDRGGHDRMVTAIRVTCTDGRIIEDRAEVFRGHPERPMTRAEIEAKFRDCAALALPEREATEAIERVWRLERLDRVTDLIGPLAGKVA